MRHPLRAHFRSHLCRFARTWIAPEKSDLMADASERLLLIVTGSTLRAEEVDRPLAYYLKQRIEQQLASMPVDTITPRVVADFRWLNDDPLQSLPTISVGGPGVNALASQFYDQLTFALAIDDHYCIQMDPTFEELRVSIWGMDNAKTQIAVAVFLERYLSSFLEACSKHAFDTSLFDPDADAEVDPDGDDDELDL
jgi:hypothetical protein